MKTLSIIIPVYNEAKTVNTLLNRVFQVKLTNWKIEVRGDSQAESEAPQAVAEIGGEVIIQGEEAEDVGETGKAEEIAGAEKAKEALATTGEKKRKKKTDAKAAKVTTEAKGSKTKTTKRASPKKKTA